MRSRIPIIFGTGSLGAEGPQSNGARIHTVEDAQAVVNYYMEHGYNTIDTARIYGGGTSEEVGWPTVTPFVQFISSSFWARWTVIDTKVFPGHHGDFSEAGIRESLNRSLTALGKHKIRTLYLHAPDPTVPIETTLQAINDPYTEGHFGQFGLSNYSSWQVAEIVGIATHHGWVRPTVYQGGYNAIARTVEAELIPCLRHFGIKFYAYSPLAGGLLAGEILSEEDMVARKGGRWDPQACSFAPALRLQYSPMLPAVKELREALDKHGLALPDACQRWLQHHSALEQGDAVILGAASVKQLGMNISHCELGPLPGDVVELFERAWLGVKGFAVHYTS